MTLASRMLLNAFPAGKIADFFSFRFRRRALVSIPLFPDPRSKFPDTAWQIPCSVEQGIASQVFESALQMIGKVAHEVQNLAYSLLNSLLAGNSDWRRVRM